MNCFTDLRKFNRKLKIKLHYTFPELNSILMIGKIYILLFNNQQIN